MICIKRNRAKNSSHQIEVKGNCAGAANVKPYHHQDIQASRYKRKPDMNTIESCF